MGLDGTVKTWRCSLTHLHNVCLSVSFGSTFFIHSLDASHMWITSHCPCRWEPGHWKLSFKETKQLCKTKWSEQSSRSSTQHEVIRSGQVTRPGGLSLSSQFRKAFTDWMYWVLFFLKVQQFSLEILNVSDFSWGISCPKRWFKCWYYTTWRSINLQSFIEP